MCSVYQFPSKFTESELIDVIEFINRDPEIDGYIIDESQRKVLFREEELDLTTKEFDLLILFVKNKVLLSSAYVYLVV